MHGTVLTAHINTLYLQNAESLDVKPNGADIDRHSLKWYGSQVQQTLVLRCTCVSEKDGVIKRVNENDVAMRNNGICKG